MTPPHPTDITVTVIGKQLFPPINSLDSYDYYNYFYISSIPASQFRIVLKTKGYDFLLDVTPLKSAGESEEEPLPPHLKLAQGEIKAVSESAKATISKGTTLQEMIGWLIRTQGPMAEQVKRDATTFQEQGRLSGNLEENMNEVRRAKEMSLEYRKQAGEVFTEVAQIAGTIV